MARGRCPCLASGGHLGGGDFGLPEAASGARKELDAEPASAGHGGRRCKRRHCPQGDVEDGVPLTQPPSPDNHPCPCPAQVLQEEVQPVLEELVCQDYPLWRDEQRAPPPGALDANAGHESPAARIPASAKVRPSQLGVGCVLLASEQHAHLTTLARPSGAHTRP
jgi:hypothetical protein